MAAPIACAVFLLLALALPASSSAAPTYYVTIDQESVSGGSRNSGQVTRRASPRLPAGAEVRGGIRCTEVRIPGPNGTSSTTEPTDLDPGYYQIATESCVQNQNFPLRIEGAPGTIRVLGGIHTVKRAGTRLQGASAVTTGPDRTVVLTAALSSPDLGDNPPLPDQQIQFLYQDSQGVNVVIDCNDRTALNDDGDAVVSCVLRGEEADRFFAGTGLWQANYAGTTRFEGSSTTGVVAGAATTFEQAAINYQAFRQSTIDVIPQPIPPGCHRVDGSSPNAGLLTVSLSALDCDQLRALQITTRVVLTLTTIIISVNAPTNAIVDLLQSGATKAAEEAVKAFDLAQAAETVARTAVLR